LLNRSAPRVLAVVTARGGSKRIPGKNIRNFAGKQLIAWTIEAALGVRGRLHGVVVSTDDPEIASVAKRYGAEVPFLRPAEISGDLARSLPVVQHAVRFVEVRDGVPMDWVLLLQPTSPLRTSGDIAAALDLAAEGGCTSVIAVCRLDDHPVFAKRIDGNGYLIPFIFEEPEGIRRQDVEPPAYKRNGAIYLTKRDVLMEEGSIYGSSVRPYIMPAERSVDIDSEVDFLLGEILAHRPG
jgi:CMP-N,N'-diacetyllegionaminic acid synthase